MHIDSVCVDMVLVDAVQTADAAGSQAEQKLSWVVCFAGFGGCSDGGALSL